jgi:adenylosuccinate lyase
LQDFLTDLESVGQLIERLRCRGVKGTTGTQASYLTLFDGDHDKVRRLDRKFAEKIGFGGSYPVTGQTYPRKQDSQILAVLSGVGESSHKFGTDLRLLQGLGEMSEPFGSKQVGSSAAATQWFERSLDDSANRRLVIPDAFLLADAILGLAAGIVAGLQVNEERVRFHVGRELPFIATETLLMKATVGGGDRQQLHEIIRTHSMTAHAAVAAGGENPLIDLLVEDPDFHLESTEIESTLDPIQYTGRASDQVTEFLDEVVAPTLENVEIAAVVEPRV